MAKTKKRKVRVKKITLQIPCYYCGVIMVYSGKKSEDGFMIYNHPGPCFDARGKNRLEVKS